MNVIHESPTILLIEDRGDWGDRAFAVAAAIGCLVFGFYLYRSFSGGPASAITLSLLMTGALVCISLSSLYTAFVTAETYEFNKAVGKYRVERHGLFRRSFEGDLTQIKAVRVKKRVSTRARISYFILLEGASGDLPDFEGGETAGPLRLPVARPGRGKHEVLDAVESLRSFLGLRAESNLPAGHISRGRA